MYKIVGRTEDNKVIAVLDSNDNTAEPFTDLELGLLLNTGVSVEGAKINPATKTLELDNSIPFLNPDGTLQTDSEFEEEVDEYAIDEDEEWEEEDIDEVFEEDSREEKAEELYNKLNNSDEDAVAKYIQGILPETEKTDLLSRYTVDDINLLNEFYDFSDIEYEEEDDDDEYTEVEEHTDGDDLNTENAVTKLYRLLTPTQKQIIQTYYLWYSRHIFESSDKAQDGTSAVNQSLKRQKKLKIMADKRKESEHWIYGGFVDFGEVVNERKDMIGASDEDRDRFQCDFGAGYGHGHNLRYMHIIWDADYGDLDQIFFLGEHVSPTFTYNSDFFEVTQSEHSIKSGINCLADFFEVDDKKAVVRELMAVQRSAISDLELLYQIYTEEDVDAVKHSFDLLTSVVNASYTTLIKSLMLKRDGVDKNTFIPLKHYKAMIENDIVPPRSLVQTIRDILAGWYKDTRTPKLTYKTHTFSGKDFYYNFKVFYSDSTIKAIVNNCPEIDKSKIDLNYVCANLEKNTSGVGYYRISSLVRPSTPKDILMGYLTYLLTIKICGFYENNAPDVYIDKNKKAEDRECKYKFISEGGASKEVAYTYRCIRQIYSPQGITHDLNTLGNVLYALTLINDINNEKDAQTAQYRRVYSVQYDDEKKDYKVLAKISNSAYDLDYALPNEVKAQYSEYTYWLASIIHNHALRYSDRFVDKVLKGIQYLIQTHEQFDEALKASVTEQVLARREEEKAKQAALEVERQHKEQLMQEAALSKQKEEEFNARMDSYFGNLEDKQTAVSDKDVLDFLETYDFSTANLDATQTKNRQIFNSWYTKKDTYATPTPNMMYRIRQLYDSLQPQSQPANTSVTLTSIPEAVNAVDWVLNNPKGIDSRTISILKTVKTKDSISKRQSKYVIEAIKLANKAKDTALAEI